jgi:hypothetical protein
MLRLQSYCESVLVSMGFDDVTVPDGIDVPRLVCFDPQRRMVMSEIINVGLDLEKNVFQAHGSDATGRAVTRKELRRARVLEFFAALFRKWSEGRTSPFPGRI